VNVNVSRSTGNVWRTLGRRSNKYKMCRASGWKQNKSRLAVNSGRWWRVSPWISQEVIGRGQCWRGVPKSYSTRKECLQAVHVGVAMKNVCIWFCDLWCAYQRWVEVLYGAVGIAARPLWIRYNIHRRWCRGSHLSFWSMAVTTLEVYV